MILFREVEEEDGAPSNKTSFTTVKRKRMKAMMQTRSTLTITKTKWAAETKMKKKVTNNSQWTDSSSKDTMMIIKDLQVLLRHNASRLLTQMRA